MKNKIIYSTIGILLISITIAVISLNDIYKVNENIDIDLDSNIKTWIDNNIDNAYWIGNSLEPHNDNMFIQTFSYKLDGNIIKERHKLIKNYEKESLYCNKMQIIGNCIEYDEKEICILRANPYCLEWLNTDINIILNDARKQKTEEIYNKIYRAFNKPQNTIIDTGNKTIRIQ